MPAPLSLGTKSDPWPKAGPTSGTDHNSSLIRRWSKAPLMKMKTGYYRADQGLVGRRLGHGCGSTKARQWQWLRAPAMMRTHQRVAQ